MLVEQRLNRIGRARGLRSVKTHRDGSIRPSAVPRAATVPVVHNPSMATAGGVPVPGAEFNESVKNHSSYRAAVVGYRTRRMVAASPRRCISHRSNS
jgi:hypothetical protein